MKFWLILFFTCSSWALSAQQTWSMSGRGVEGYPHILLTNTFNAGTPIHMVIPPELFVGGSGSVDVYVVEHQTDEEWSVNPVLNDVRPSGAQSVFYTMGTAADNVFELNETSTLSSNNGLRPGHSYDLVLDLDGDGEMGAMDWLDGGSEPGFYVVGNLNDPGPLDVTSFVYELDFWHTMEVFHPTELDGLGMRPLVVISHGWTHEYTYYDYLAEHLASYGYVVISHRNDVGNGGAAATETASQTALENIDTFLTHYPEMSGGELAGHINKHLIVHAGHSTGGECVVRAYKRLATGDYLSPHITHEDIVLVNSFAPVSFLAAEEVDPMNANFHEFFCGADTDVSGAPLDGYVQGLAIYERGTGNKQVTYIHGAGHEDLHGNPGDSWASGPDLIGREATHTVVRPYFLALCELYVHNSGAFKEFFTRNHAEFVPLGVQPGITVTGEYRDALALTDVIDDFQSGDGIATATCGAPTYHTLEHAEEILMHDTDESFEFTGENWGNGMVRSRYDDTPSCGVIAWQEDGVFCLNLEADFYDWEGNDVLSFRAAQLTRHPYNTPGQPVDFELYIEDDDGYFVTFPIQDLGPLLPPYPRSSGGYYTDCLEPGTYTVIIGGSTYPEEMLLTIPGFLEDAEAGTHTFTIPEGEPCTEVEFLCYDTWGDGWDNGTFQLLNADEALLLEGTLPGGSAPDSGAGWQNEFHTYTLDLNQLRTLEWYFDTDEVEELCFHVGPSHGSASGAIAIDDIALTQSGLSFVANVDEASTVAPSMHLFPNPATTHVRVDPGTVSQDWVCRVLNATGQLVLESGNVRGVQVLDTSNWAPGCYVIQVVSGGGLAAQPLIVEP